MEFKELQTMLAGQLSVDEEKVVKEASIIDDLGADSLEVVELLMELESNYGITIPDDEAKHLKTVGDIFSYIENVK